MKKMTKMNMTHEAKNILHVYGHLLYEVNLAAERHNDEKLHKVQMMMRRLRNKFELLLDDVYNVLEDERTRYFQQDG